MVIVFWRPKKWYQRLKQQDLWFILTSRLSNLSWKIIHSHQCCLWEDSHGESSEFKFSEKELWLGYAGNICFSNPQKQRLLKLRNPVLSDFLNYLTQRVINLSQAHIYGWVIQHWPLFPLKNAFNYLKRTKSSDFAKAVGKRSFVCWSAFQASVFRLRWKLCLLDTFHSTFNHFLSYYRKWAFRRCRSDQCTLKRFRSRLRDKQF